jgi:protease IV
MDEKMDNQLIERVLLAHVEEQRKARRWGIIWRVMGFVVILIAVSVSFFSGGAATRMPPSTPHTAMVDLSGVIDSKGDASAAVINEALRMAFESKSAKGIILRVNSPGGSPVQSGIVFDEIRRLRAAHADKPLIAVVEDVAASGGYYIAAAADSIYVDKASLIGSIGVRMDSFGFTEAMKKLGVERRVLTAGENKAMLDPFLPVDPKQKAAIQSMLGEVHQQFVNAVKEGRGERLKSDPELFTGMVWTGSKSIELGLTDGLGTIDSVARDVIKAEEIVDYTMQPNLLERLSRRFGASMGESMARVMMHWSIQ